MPAPPDSAPALPPKATTPLAPEQRARRLENLRKAWRAPRRKRGPLNRAQRASARANLVRAREALRQRGWPHSDSQRAAARMNIRKAQAAITARGLATTPARRAASKENLAKANARLRELGYARSERQKAAARANLGKARGAGAHPANYDRYHRHKLKHGLMARTLEQTLRLLDEDPRQFGAHCERFRHVFAPADPLEEQVVRRIATATWRQLRLFRAQAKWQSDALAHYFDRAQRPEKLDAVLTNQRRVFLMSLLLDRERFDRHDQRLTRGVERALSLLVHMRARDNPEFQAVARHSKRNRREFERHEKELKEEYRRLEESNRRPDFKERRGAGDPAAFKLQEGAGQESSDQACRTATPCIPPRAGVEKR